MFRLKVNGSVAESRRSEQMPLFLLSSTGAPPTSHRGWLRRAGYDSCDARQVLRASGIVRSCSLACRVGSLKVTAGRLPIVLQIGVESGSRGQLG
jgi:hypothetical protein